MKQHSIKTSKKRAYILNLANSISLGRILLIPFFMAFLLSRLTYGDWIAIAIFIVAAVSDGLDGYFARNRKQQTLFGQFLDPLADKLLISAALITLVERHHLSSWIATVIIGREFAVSGLRLMAIAEKRIIPSSVWGKTKTTLQVVAVVAWILIPRVEMMNSIGAYYSYLAGFIMALAIIFTLISGVDYFLKLRDILLDKRQ